MMTGIMTAEKERLITKTAGIKVEPEAYFCFSDEETKKLIRKTNKSFRENFLPKTEERLQAGYIIRCNFRKNVKYEKGLEFLLKNKDSLTIPLCRAKQQMEEQFYRPEEIRRCFFITPNVHGVPMLIQSLSSPTKSGLSLASYPECQQAKHTEMTRREWKECLRYVWEAEKTLFFFRPEE